VIRPGSRLAPRAATASRLPRAALVIGAVVGSLALGGCAAGQVAQTAYQSNSSGGATVTSNGIAIRDAQIAFGNNVEGAAVHARGSNAPIEMHVINQSTQDDRLVAASSPVAASVQITGPADLPAGVAMVVGGESGTAGQTAPGASEQTAEPRLDATLAPVPGQTVEPTASVGQENTSPTGSESPSGEAPAAGLQPPPPIAAVVPSTRYTQIVLTGLREDVRAGLAYEIDLTFERAGVIKVQLPVAYPAQPRPPAEHAE
jgi:copper(I)-binding protein